jgi:hypothetical protein
MLPAKHTALVATLSQEMHDSAKIIGMNSKTEALFQLIN